MKNIKFKCDRCHDKGFIDTGNNDLPCRCEKGLNHMFNVCGEDYPISGKELLRKDSLHLNKNYLD